MTTAQSTRTNIPLLAWRDAVVAVTAVVLIAVSLLHMHSVVPVYQVMLAHGGATLDALARLPIIVWAWKLPVLVALVVVLAASFWLDKKDSGRRLSAAITLLGLAAAIYVSLIAHVYLEAARVLPGLVSGGH